MDIDPNSDWNRKLPQYVALLALSRNKDAKEKRVSIRAKHIPAIVEALFHFMETTKERTNDRPD